MLYVLMIYFIIEIRTMLYWGGGNMHNNHFYIHKDNVEDTKLNRKWTWKLKDCSACGTVSDVCVLTMLQETVTTTNNEAGVNLLKDQKLLLSK